MARQLPGSAAAEWRRNWPLVATTTAGMSLAALPTFSLGVMIAPIEQEFGWSRSEITSGPALVSMMGILLATLAGVAIDRLGARLVGIMVVIISSSGIALISTMQNSLYQWWATWALIGVAATATSTVWVAPVSAIFSAGRGLAIAITVGGVAISNALAPPLAEYFIQNHGWRFGFLAMAAIWFSATIPLVLAFMPRKARITAGEAGSGGADSAPIALTGLTPREGFRTPALYMLFFASLFGSFAGVALIFNLVPMLFDNGISRADAVLIAGSMGISSIIGRLGGGWLMDNFNVRIIAIWAALLSLIFPSALLAMPGSVGAAYAAVILYGFTGGAKGNAIIYLTSTYLGGRSFGTFYGTISTTTAIASGIAPLAASYIYDVTGSYSIMIVAVIPSFLIAAGLLFMLGPYPDFGQREARA